MFPKGKGSLSVIQIRIQRSPFIGTLQVTRTGFAILAMFCKLWPPYQTPLSQRQIILLRKMWFIFATKFIATWEWRKPRFTAVGKPLHFWEFKMSIKSDLVFPAELFLVSFPDSLLKNWLAAGTWLGYSPIRRNLGEFGFRSGAWNNSGLRGLPNQVPVNCRSEWILRDLP